MESVPSTSMDEIRVIDHDRDIRCATETSENTTINIFKCFYCSLEERFDFKGVKPPFAKQLVYTEEVYVMKDPFSLPNTGEVLILGADCSICKTPVCLDCSIYFGKRFCFKCALKNMKNLPLQLHSKIKFNQ